MSLVNTVNKRRQLEFRIIGHTPNDVEDAMRLIVERCFPSAYCSQVKENDHGHFKFRAYVSVVLNGEGASE